jgi:hypothetical protein
MWGPNWIKFGLTLTRVINCNPGVLGCEIWALWSLVRVQHEVWVFEVLGFEVWLCELWRCEFCQGC